MTANRASGPRPLGGLAPVAALLLAGFWAIGCARALAAEPPRLVMPVDCTFGGDCFIQNYVDVGPGQRGVDHACGTLANPGHSGTDFRVRDLLDVAAGVPVLAAAAGTVAHVRDGVPDGFPDERPASSYQGRECGNGVLLDHGGGWQTQYCHMRQGSLSVAPGDRVQAGARLGLVGMSGLAEFPHLHFTVWHGESAVDPFLGPDAKAGCRSARRPLWQVDALRRLAYQPSGVLNAGFSDVEPSLRAVERGDTRHRPPGSQSSLWFYVRLFGLQRGDRQRLRVFDPAGRLVMEWTGGPAPAAEVEWLQPIGRHPPTQGWPSGRYRGEFLLIRDGAVVVDHLAESEIR